MWNAKRFLIPSLGLAAVAFFSAAVVFNDHGNSHAPASRPVAQSQLAVDLSLGETFTPATPAASSGVVGTTRLSANSRVEPNALTAQSAYSKALNTESTIPSTATVQSGYLTMPLGDGAPGQYAADHELVYAYSWPGCPPSVGLPALQPGASESSSAAVSEASTDCTAWAFVNPTTGELVDMTWTK